MSMRALIDGTGAWWRRGAAVVLALAVTGVGVAEEADRLRVLVWNVLHGANDVDQGPEKALAIIRAAEPDIVLLQESYDIDGDRPKLGAWLAGELGWHQHQEPSRHLCVLTPLAVETTFFHHEWHGVGALLRDARGRELLVWSIWIDWKHFVGYVLRDEPESEDAALLACETDRSGRFRQATALIEHLREAGQLDASVPLLVGGDWNCPSHLDWTRDTERVFPRRRTLPLPVSLAMHEAGFSDVFRMLHPNPVHHPGITWSPMYRGPVRGQAGTPQAFERIDRLYLKNPAAGDGVWRLNPIATRVLPELWEDDTVAVRERAFPSDHGALLVELQWADDADDPGEAASSGP